MVDKETCILSDLTPAVIEGIVLHGEDDMGSASNDHEVVEILKKENTLLRRQLMLACSPASRIEDNDEKTGFLTGIPSYSVFTTLLNLLSPLISTSATGCGLSSND